MYLTNKHSNIQQRIINSLLLHSSFSDNLGLFNGKMGIAIAFFHLFRQTGNTLYENYAGELIDEIYEEININTHFGFEEGIAGIGWGIDYLIKKQFIEADPDEVLADIDNRLTPYVYSFPSSLSLGNGLLGIGRYYLSRVQREDANEESARLLKNKQLLIFVLDEISRRVTNTTTLYNEPVSALNEKDTPRSGDVSDNGNSSHKFDLTWDYPVLLTFLSEVFTLNLYNIRVCGLLERLLKPLLNTQNWPQLHCNRLLLALALSKLLKEYKVPVFDNPPASWPDNAFFVKFDGNPEQLTDELLNGISHQKITDEVGSTDPFMKNGALGIAWVYSQLYQITGNNGYQSEAEYWYDFAKDKYILINNSNVNIDKEFARLGLLNGITGFIINNNRDGKN
jgi:hypothetical protein